MALTFRNLLCQLVQCSEIHKLLLVQSKVTAFIYRFKESYIESMSLGVAKTILQFITEEKMTCRFKSTIV